MTSSWPMSAKRGNVATETVEPDLRRGRRQAGRRLWRRLPVCHGRRVLHDRGPRRPDFARGARTARRVPAVVTLEPTLFRPNLVNSPSPHVSIAHGRHGRSGAPRADAGRRAGADSNLTPDELPTRAASSRPMGCDGSAAVGSVGACATRPSEHGRQAPTRSSSTVAVPHLPGPTLQHSRGLRGGHDTERSSA